MIHSQSIYHKKNTKLSPSNPLLSWWSRDQLIPITHLWCLFSSDIINPNHFSSPSLIGSSGEEPGCTGAGRGTRGSGHRREREQHGPTCKCLSTFTSSPSVAFGGVVILEPRSFDRTQGVGGGVTQRKVSQCGSESKGRGFEHVIVGMK